MASAVEGPNGKNPVVHHDNHLGRPRHLRVPSCRVFVGTQAGLESSIDKSGKHRQDGPAPCRRRWSGGLSGNQIPGTTAGKRYEERASREETREKDRLINTKMQDAVNQLGSDKVSTRIAGVYALTDIADTCRGGYRQRVVDILCGYLRSDRTSYALDEFGNTVKDEFGRLVKSGSSDEAVESTILGMFAVHLRKERRSRENEVTVRQQVEDDQLWCDCRFDFHGTAFHGAVSFVYFMFENETGFSDVTFEDMADFSDATFKDRAGFSNATFESMAGFSDATFKNGADFSNATFNRKYRNATFPFYQWGPISIPPYNDGLPAGARWAELEENS